MVKRTAGGGRLKMPPQTALPDVTAASPMTLRDLLLHSGVISSARLRVLLASNQVGLNDGPFDGSIQPRSGDQVQIEGQPYRVVSGGGCGRLQVEADQSSVRPITGQVRVHAGFHKCMTEFTKRVYRRTCRNPLLRGGSFEHYFHRLDAFYNHCEQHTVCSVSGNAIDLDRFADIRVVRFIRDPRDLLVSAYHYHRRAAESWCMLKDPTDLDWRIVNGAVPQGLRHGESLTEFLNRAPLQQGLAAELEFRRHHFDSMRAWPASDPRVRLFRYEDVLGNEGAVFREIASFFGLAIWTRPLMAYLARRYAASARGGKQDHIRNAVGGQWREHFGPEIRRRFNAQYGDLLQRYGYPES
ncbi:MAG: sulfotransferase domain-containing protein [Immundisolibacter sp.]|uniref:sulfotransferase domain-containing protein n=1 Tax=Immundisolibacter sp. TaxID=1934948 RepID=UPI003EE27E12